MAVHLLGQAGADAGPRQRPAPSAPCGAQFHLRQVDTGTVHYRVVARGQACSPSGDAAALRNFFTLDTKLAEVGRKWSQDARFRAVAPHFQGACRASLPGPCAASCLPPATMSVPACIKGPKHTLASQNAALRWTGSKALPAEQQQDCHTAQRGCSLRRGAHAAAGPRAVPLPVHLLVQQPHLQDTRHGLAPVRGVRHPSVACV